MISYFSDFFREEGSPLGELALKYPTPWDAVYDVANIISELLPSLSGYSEIAPEVWAHETAALSPAATLFGPCVIGEKTEVRPGAFIRGDVIVGKGCVIGNSTELKSSLIFDFCQLPHYNYVGNSILLSRAHLGAGAIISNLKSDKSEIVVRTPSGDFPTEKHKLGALVGRGAEVGCGAVLCPGSVLEAGCIVYPLVCVRGFVRSGVRLKHS